MNHEELHYLVVDCSASEEKTILATVLENESVSVTTAHDVTTAVKYLSTESYSCLVLNPPEQKGADECLLDQLSTRSGDIPFILLNRTDRSSSIDWSTRTDTAHTVQFDPMNPTEVVTPIRNIVADATVEEQLAEHRTLRKTVKDTILALENASSDTTIYRTVCRHLVESGLYHSAWWSAYDVDSQILTPTIADGISCQQLAAIHIDDREIDTSPTASSESDDTHSTIQLPIHGKSALEGVFSLVTRRHVDDAERETLTELQTTVASRITHSDRTMTDSPSTTPPLEFFTGAFSHELRNHLQKAKSALDTARQGDTELEEIEHYLDQIQDLDHAVALLAKDELDPQSISVVQLTEIVNTVRNRCSENEDAITIVDSPAVRGNRQLLELLVENLVRNAFDHGGAEAHVRIGALENGFFVEDTGTGIPAEHRDDLFKWGFSPTGNSGKGLAIVKRIVDLHGWTITITDSDSGGARFEIETTKSVPDPSTPDLTSYK